MEYLPTISGLYPRPPVGESQCPRPRRRSARAGGGGATRFYMLGSWALVASSVPGPPRAKMQSKRFKTLQNAPGRPPPKPSVPSWRPKRTATFQNGIENAVQTLQNAPKRCGTTAPEAKCSLVATQADRHDSKTLQNVPGRPPRGQVFPRGDPSGSQRPQNAVQTLQNAPKST